MIKIKRLLYVAAFAGLCLFIGLFYYQQLMRKTLTQLAHTTTPFIDYRKQAVQALSHVYNGMIKGTGGDLRFRDGLVIRKAEQVIIDYYIIS